MMLQPVHTISHAIHNIIMLAIRKTAELIQENFSNLVAHRQINLEQTIKNHIPQWSSTVNLRLDRLGLLHAITSQL